MHGIPGIKASVNAARIEIVSARRNLIIRGEKLRVRIEYSAAASIRPAICAACRSSSGPRRARINQPSEEKRAEVCLRDARRGPGGYWRRAFRVAAPAA